MRIWPPPLGGACHGSAAAGLRGACVLVPCRMVCACVRVGMCGSCMCEWSMREGERCVLADCAHGAGDVARAHVVWGRPHGRFVDSCSHVGLWMCAQPSAAMLGWGLRHDFMFVHVRDRVMIDVRRRRRVTCDCERALERWGRCELCLRVSWLFLLVREGRELKQR